MTTATIDLIDLAHGSTDAAAFERATLAALQRAVGFDAAFFATPGEAPTTVQIDPAALALAFAERRYVRELLPLKQAAMDARGVAVDTRLAAERAVQRRAYHRHFAAPIGGRHTLMAWATLRGRPLAALMLGRTGSPFSDAELAVIQAMLPSLAVARASFHHPWRGPLLPSAGASTLTAALASWARGESVLASVGDAPDALVVRDRDGHREMVARHAHGELVWTRSRRSDPRRSGWFYVDLFHLAAARARSRGRALFVGAGGAVAVRQFAEVYPGIALDLVELDPRVVDLARDWFGLASVPNVTVHLDEGAAFLARAPANRWDVVVVDAYEGGEVPAALASRAFFRDLRRVLRGGGCVAFNVIGALSGDGAVRAIERAARRELDDVRLVPVLDPCEAFSPTAVRNVVVLASCDR